MFETLKDAPRLLLEQDLWPVQGDRFQPTGFADLGAAVYENGKGVRMLLVESAQSVANRLEQVCLASRGPALSEELNGLPYVRVKLTGEADSVTTSLVEAHRLNSPFVVGNKEFAKEFQDRTGYREGKPIDWKKVASAVLYYDPGSLLHGLFMSNMGDGRMRLPRMVTGFVEASDVRDAASGGVKNNSFDPSGRIVAVDGSAKEVYSNVPYARMEFTAAKITAYFNLDLSLLAGYEMSGPANSLMIALALFKVRRFLRVGMRLRTACDFVSQGELRVKAPAGFVVPQESELLAEAQKRIKECREAGLLGSSPLDLETKCAIKKETKKDKAATAAQG